MSELFLVRHAQASFGKADYDQLSELGVNQSRWLGEYFRRQGIEFTKLIVGNMRRHNQTLDGICEAMGTRDQDRTVIPGLNEYDFAELTAAYAESFPNDSLLQKVKKFPSIMTCRSNLSQGKSRLTRAFDLISIDLRLSKFVKNTKPVLSNDFNRTIR